MGQTIFGKSQNEDEFHLFILGLGGCGEKIEFTHTKTTNTFF